MNAPRTGYGLYDSYAFTSPKQPTRTIVSGSSGQNKKASYHLLPGAPRVKAGCEAFLAVLLNRVQSGMIIMDEPESALSPQLTFPEADIVSLDDIPMRSVKLEDTSHYQITRAILDAPERYWRLLRSEVVKDDDQT